MEYKMNCGCVVTLEPLLSSSCPILDISCKIIYCAAHEIKRLSAPAEYLVAFTEAADKLARDANQNMEEVAGAARLLINSIGKIAKVKPAAEDEHVQIPQIDPRTKDFCPECGSMIFWNYKHKAYLGKCMGCSRIWSRSASLKSGL